MVQANYTDAASVPLFGPSASLLYPQISLKDTLTLFSDLSTDHQESSCDRILCFAYRCRLYPVPGCLCLPLSPDGTAFCDSTLSTTIGVAVDGSGNIWVVNNGRDIVTGIIGSAIPVITPLVAAFAANKLGNRP